MDEILETVRGFDGVLELAPQEGSEFPEIAWGDHFFYYSPDGSIPQNRQPFATIVTKDYPDDAGSNLDGPGRSRLNIHVGSAAVTELTRETSPLVPQIFSETDVILPHPVYGALGWIAIVNPGNRVTAAAVQLLREAHLTERRRVDRRSEIRGQEDVGGVES